MKYKNRTKYRDNDSTPDTDRKIDESRYRDSHRRRGQSDKHHREMMALAEYDAFYQK